MITPEQLAASGSEDSHQAGLFCWAALNVDIYPELRMFFHCPNGGMRSAKEGARMKKLGAKAGYPDVGLNCARRGYHALFIEMKVGNNKPTDEQLKWHKWLTDEGNIVTVCYSWQEARDVLIWYLA